jgi:hypothetical protein
MKSPTLPEKAPSPLQWLAAAAGVLLLQALLLRLMGQPLICACGVVRLWYSGVSGPETSQQVFDWYSFTHMVHGIGLYFVAYRLWRGKPASARFVLALGIEAGWEVFENTPFVIDRYRQLALAQGYFGDSILNSLADTVTAAFGFALARVLPVWASVVTAVLLEILLIVMVRDSLTLNIIQLVFASDIISDWQVGH